MIKTSIFTSTCIFATAIMTQVATASVDPTHRLPLHSQENRMISTVANSTIPKEALFVPNNAALEDADFDVSPRYRWPAE